jgi:Na+/H+-dicarboxylate symporter
MPYLMTYHSLALEVFLGIALGIALGIVLGIFWQALR